MNRPLLILVFFLQLTYCSAQDIPLFTQKLTNSFLYNPSVAGNTKGSLTLSHRQYWSGVQDSPNTNFLSFHVPFAYHKLGFGVNFYQDNIGVSQTLFTSAAFAYHIRFTDDNSLSMGASVEYDNFKVNALKADVVDLDDDLINNGGVYSQVDFSFGLSYQSKYVNIGGSLNRIRDFLNQSDTSVNEFPAYYSAFVNLKFPLASGRDLLEPIVNYRSLAPGSNQIDAGLYYTYKELATLGGGYRTGGIVNLTAAVRVHKNILIGYSREMFSGNFQRSIGATNEFTLRIDFKDHNFYNKSRNSRQINTQALAIRRKTLSSTYSGRGTAMQKSQRYKKKVKKNYIHSPNYRINSSKKLMTKSSKGKSYNKKRTHKKPSRRRG